jgi:anaerobic ribonucleoside-triphosphate reductase activating protein
VIWVQGCTLACPGCFNPGTWDLRDGWPVTVPHLLHRLRAIAGIEGITISGGEPLQQRGPLEVLLREVRTTTDLSIVLFTGYDWEHITRTPGFLPVAQLADIVVAGPYRRHQRLERGLRGSANQTIHLLTRRYTVADVEAVPGTEVVIGSERAVVTGVAVPDG